ncbi:uncharacterized protein BO87DRAFT_44076 [Aspergillus neoniger CBS 115656]|uniref:Uncharacterized protein n=1 Tax=Aspergillus neoniger (strain CBS 115656) TaxID=1448310 RepID=A0A318YJU4_ASPNB|nr:hypothetical protein BO87DRAFT_44076 [Aspergillus neoniger CBS 115656]PYH34821.1 hypothetical protein BO87DRAFT_44076 [Aspergillus neoniger CBS 115656]
MGRRGEGEEWNGGGTSQSGRSVGERVKQSKAKSKHKPKRHQKSKRKARKKAAPRKARDSPALIGSWPEGVPHLACLIGLSQVAFPPRYLTLFMLFSFCVSLYFGTGSDRDYCRIHRKETGGLSPLRREDWHGRVNWKESREKRGDGQPGIRPFRFCLRTTVKILPSYPYLSFSTSKICTQQNTSAPKRHAN